MTEAILAQLRAEIAASDHGNMKAVAAEMEIDYWTLRKYLRGEREMPLDVLTRVTTVLGLDLSALASRARERMRSSGSGA